MALTKASSVIWADPINNTDSYFHVVWDNNNTSEYTNTSEFTPFVDYLHDPATKEKKAKVRPMLEEPLKIIEDLRNTLTNILPKLKRKERKRLLKYYGTRFFTPDIFSKRRIDDK